MRITLLGTGAALSDPERCTTMLAIRQHEGGVWLVDCGGDVAQRFMFSGGSLEEICGLILTHEHIDHVAGFPLLMEKLWLSGRREPLPVYGIEPALRQAQRVFEAFDTSGWTGMPEREEHVVDPDADPVLIAAGVDGIDTDFTVRCVWAKHSKPVIALRFESGGGVCTYSADTEYCDSVVGLANGSDLLIHEATGNFPGHSSAVEAARVATEAGASRLVLVHLPGESAEFRSNLAEARSVFPQTAPGIELGQYDVGGL